jgi:hypothetical protein
MVVRKRKEKHMFLKKLAVTTLAGSALLAASTAFAHDGHWNRGHRWHHHGYYAPQRVVVVPRAPVYYAPPAPAYYAPAPVYGPPVYVAPRPTIVYRQPGFSIGVGF